MTIENLNADPVAVMTLCGLISGAASSKRVQNYVPWVGGEEDRPFRYHEL